MSVPVWPCEVVICLREGGYVVFVIADPQLVREVLFPVATERGLQEVRALKARSAPFRPLEKGPYPTPLPTSEMRKAELAL